MVETGIESAPAGPGLLSDVHAELGAELRSGPGGGDEALHYGSAVEEYRLLGTGCGVADRTRVPCLELRGEDRVRFLNGLITAEVKDLGPGAGGYGYLLDVKGRILADAGILAAEDRLWLELPPGAGATLAAHLGKYVIADRVTIETVADRACLLVVGQGAGERLAELVDGGSPPAAPWGHLVLRLLGYEVRAVRHPRHGVPAFALWVGAAAAPELFRRLVDRGLAPIGREALEMRRVEAGIPLCGVDFGAENFPQEAGEEGAVSYTKGCYLGQEIVARIHYRGGVNRILRGLRLAGGKAPPAGGEVRFEGREAGRLTSAVLSPAVGGPIGLCLIHRRAGEVGTAVEVEGAGPAVVAELPFVAS